MNELPAQDETMSTHVSSVGGHDGQAVFVDDLLHLLNTSQISQHVSDRNNVTVLDELLSDLFGSLDRSSTDGLSRQLY